MQFGGTHQIITEMQPGDVIKGTIELSWMDDQSQDWSVTTWAKKGKVQVALTSMPSRPSDTVVGYYAGEAPESSYEPVPVPEGETPGKVLSGDEESGAGDGEEGTGADDWSDDWSDDYYYESGPQDGQAPEYYVGYEDGLDDGYWEGYDYGFDQGVNLFIEDGEWEY